MKTCQAKRKGKMSSGHRAQQCFPAKCPRCKIAATLIDTQVVFIKFQQRHKENAIKRPTQKGKGDGCGGKMWKRVPCSSASHIEQKDGLEISWVGRKLQAWGHRAGGWCSLTFLPLFLCLEIIKDSPCCPWLCLCFLAMPGSYCPEQGRFCSPLCLILCSESWENTVWNRRKCGPGDKHLPCSGQPPLVSLAIHLPKSAADFHLSVLIKLLLEQTTL